MDQFPQMLYRAGGSEEIHGGKFATHIVHDEAELEQALADGWHETTAAALKASRAAAAADIPDDNAPPTRAELEAKATELNIKFDARWGDKKLGDAIAAALKA